MMKLSTVRRMRKQRIVLLLLALLLIGAFVLPSALLNAAPAQRRAAPGDDAARAAATPTLTPVPRPSGPPRIGVQVGHWKSNELPDELARLRGSTGAHAAGYAEADVNYAIATRTKTLLEQRGYIVDLLPATVPVSYAADAFVAIHADGAASSASRGFKVATPWRTSRASQHLNDVLTAEYGAATGLRRDGAITMNMRGYYAFSYNRHQHAVARTTPAVIIETGFLTNAADRALLVGQPDIVAIGIANGITRYLDERDPTDLAALEPPVFKVQRPLSAEGVLVRAAPSDTARVVGRAPADARLVPFQQRESWYNVFVRGSNGRLIGWVRIDQVVQTDDPTPTPPPVTDT